MSNLGSGWLFTSTIRHGVWSKGQCPDQETQPIDLHVTLISSRTLVKLFQFFNSWFLHPSSDGVWVRIVFFHQK